MKLIAFRRTYEEPLVALQQPECGAEQRELGESRAQQLSQLTQQFFLRRSQQLLNDHLPPKVECVVFCRPTRRQVQLYRSLLDSSAVRCVFSSAYSGTSHLRYILALRKLCNHPALFASKDFDEMDQFDGEEEEEECGQLNDDILSLAAVDPSDGSGKLDTTLSLVDCLMSETKEKLVFVSYSTKVIDVMICSFVRFNLTNLISTRWIRCWI